MKDTFRLRNHHIPEIHAFMFYGSREEFDRARRIDRAVHRAKYSDEFFDNVGNLLEKFWAEKYTHLEVVAAADDFCATCRDETCEGRNVPDKYDPTHPNRIFWLEPGIYEAEEIKKMIREIDRREREGEHLPEVKIKPSKSSKS